MSNKQMFKVIVQNDNDKKRIFYTLIDLSEFNHARPYLHKAIKEHIEPGFFPEPNAPKDYELFWVDDKHDIVLIKSWWDLHNYVAYLTPKGQKYLELYVRPNGYRNRMETLKKLKLEQTETVEMILGNTDWYENRLNHVLS